MNCLDQLGKRILYWDGGMGSMLQERGLGGGELPELWNLRRSEDIIEIHQAYLEAGADIINANTFGANGLKFPEGGDVPLAKVIEAAFANAREALRRSGRTDACIALDVGPTGKLLKPLGDLDFEDAVVLFSEVMRLGKRCGADLILIETMSDAYEAKAAVLAAKEQTELPVFVTMVYGDNGKLLTGTDPEAVVATLEGLGVDGLGVNCGMGPLQMEMVADELLRYASVPVIVNPNAGLPRTEGGRTVYDVEPEEFAAVMSRIAQKGAWIVGGCCGTTPEHIRLTKKLCEGTLPVPIVPKRRTVVSSYGMAVEFGRMPVIIGERINPTGKKRLKEALLAHDIEYLLQEGLKQEEKGAHILDVNVGLPGIDEPAMLTEAVTELQSILSLPLQLDTSNLTAMERALRRYNGKAMINSVNGKRESMEAVFPLVKKYGGVVVALLLDEEGIPSTAQGRIRVAEKIYRTAEEYGIGRENIVLDALAMTISSEPGAAFVTLETLRRIRDELGGRTILGVSNISFGLPQREYINAAFFTMALQNGLSAAILNPASEDMRRAYDCYCALANLDPQCQSYIEKYAAEAERKKREKAERAGRGVAAGVSLPGGRLSGTGNINIAAVSEGTPSAAAAGFERGAAGGSRSDAFAGPQPSAAAGVMLSGGRLSGTGNIAAAGGSQPDVSAGSRLAAGSPPVPSAGSQPDASAGLVLAVKKGLKEQAAAVTRKMLEEQPPLKIIDGSLVPALDEVGRGFERGTVFLPQLLMSADAAKAAFEEIRRFFQAQGTKQEKKGRIVLATVKGDIHDIGKNIVRVLLDNYGYEVIDLGRDVEPQRVVDEARRTGAPLVGLSALMTTTVVSMEETIRLLHEQLPGVKIVVGGAVLTESYAKQIGADCYGKDAMATVRYAERLFGKAQES